MSVPHNDYWVKQSGEGLCVGRSAALVTWRWWLCPRTCLLLVLPLQLNGVCMAALAVSAHVYGLCMDDLRGVCCVWALNVGRKRHLRE